MMLQDPAWRLTYQITSLLPMIGIYLNTVSSSRNATINIKLSLMLSGLTASPSGRRTPATSKLTSQSTSGKTYVLTVDVDSHKGNVVAGCRPAAPVLRLSGAFQRGLRKQAAPSPHHHANGVNDCESNRRCSFLCALD